jgi:hypothetical protein
VAKNDCRVWLNWLTDQIVAVRLLRECRGRKREKRSHPDQEQPFCGAGSFHLVSPGRRKTIALFLYAKTAFDEQFLKEKMLFCPGLHAMPEGLQFLLIKILLFQDMHVEDDQATLPNPGPGKGARYS